MARWRLLQPHYLKVPGTEWEYKETDRTTGRQGRKVYEVPLFLNPNDPADCNPRTGEIVVCHAGTGVNGDVTFEGPPTPDMEPLDDEAITITKELEPTWIHPIESLPGNFSQSLIASFEKQMGELMSQPKAVLAAGVSKEEFDALKAQMAELVSQNALLSEKAEAKGRRA